MNIWFCDQHQNYVDHRWNLIPREQPDRAITFKWPRQNVPPPRLPVSCFAGSKWSRRNVVSLLFTTQKVRWFAGDTVGIIAKRYVNPHLPQSSWTPGSHEQFLITWHTVGYPWFCKKKGKKQAQKNTLKVCHRKWSNLQGSVTTTINLAVAMELTSKC